LLSFRVRGAEVVAAVTEVGLAGGRFLRQVGPIDATTVRLRRIGA
jgi:hypothetical protein